MAKPKRRTVVYKGELFEVAREFVKRKPNGDKIFEYARRPPGVRVLLEHPEVNMYVLTREFRRELGRKDWRLPGGKVFDSLLSYQLAISKGEKIENLASIAARSECEEETGFSPGELTLIHKTSPGATFDWTLFYFHATKVGEVGQRLELGEDIKPHWLAPSQIEQMCYDGSIAEERTAYVLLKHLRTQ